MAKETVMYDEVVFGKDAHEKLAEGAKVLYDAVKVTMGPSGHSVIIDNGTTAPLITKDGVTVAKSIMLRDKLKSIGAELIKEIAAKTNELAGDGPQPLYAKVLTPNGWTTMGELKIGDLVCGTGGTIQKVIGIFPKGQKEIIEISFADGNTPTRKVECCEDHLWNITTQRGKAKTITTRQMFAESTAKKDINRGKYFVPTTPVEFKTNGKLPVDPYLLGVLLGDGSLSVKHEIEISVGSRQKYILEQLTLPSGCTLRIREYPEKNYIKGTIAGSERLGKNPNGTKSILKKSLETLGLLGTNSNTKFIPKEYLFSSIENRKKLLQGLIDTDGSISERGLFTYNTVSDRLAADFIELCRSLGMSINYRVQKRKVGDGSYSTKPIHRITQLKGNKYGLKVAKIEKTGKTTEMMCIKVSNENHLYITDSYVPTHNTTTATVLGYSLLASGLKEIGTGSGRNAVYVRKGMDLATSLVIQSLISSAVKVNGSEDIINVGTISANGDRNIGELLNEAINKVGQDGIITVEPAKSVNTTLEVVEGMQFDSGYISPFFVTNQEKLTCDLDEPMVLVTNKKITQVEDILPILEEVSKASRPLLIIGDEIEGEALHTLILNKMKGVLFSCGVKAPSYGENRTEILRDIAAVTGATVIDTSFGGSLKSVKSSHLGSCKRVIVSKGTTTIVGTGDAERLKEIEERVSTIRGILKSDTVDDKTRDNVRSRLAKLAGGIAVVKVGGSTEVEIFEKKDRVEDALNATVAAVQEGILPGGGTALLYASEGLKELMNDPTLSEDTRAGVRVVYEACRKPINIIVSNTGKSADVVIDKITEARNKTKNFGYDAAKDEYCDLVDRGIIDPLKVERYALQHAVSVVGLMLTSNCVVLVDKGNG